MDLLSHPPNLFGAGLFGYGLFAVDVSGWAPGLGPALAGAFLYAASILWICWFTGRLFAMCFRRAARESELLSDLRAAEYFGAVPLVNALLGDGFVYEPPLCGDDEKIDRLLPALDTLHVLDADSSQSLAIEEVKRGRNLIIQGPPGRGRRMA